MKDIEREFVAWLGDAAPGHDALRLGIGDDLAILDSPPVVSEAAFADAKLGDAARPAHPPQWLFGSDMLLDGVHFDSAKHEPKAIGRKAVACCLSDCAAMASRPVAVTVSLALPRSARSDTARRLLCGVFAICEEFDVAIAGGDTTTWDHPLAIDVAVVAHPFEGIEPITRSRAAPGDALFVTGKLGGSILGKHLTFTPRIAEARQLAMKFGDRISAMMDISDGLSLDLHRLCEASGVGALLDATCLATVISDDARELAESDGRTPLDHALSDGEDYELLLAVRGETESSTTADTPTGLWRIGEVTKSGLAMRGKDGTIGDLAPQGYVH